MEVVNSLITAGVDVNGRDRVRLYLRHITSHIVIGPFISVFTQDGDSVLMMAIRNGRTEVVSLLIEAGANIHLQNEVNYKFPDSPSPCIYNFELLSPDSKTEKEAVFPLR